jgi:glycerophosphoryl diester phosphodiesterase
VNDEVEMRRLLALGVDGMFTDHPDRLLAVR